ncbi:MAG TPA: protein translocase subunit SecF, partial [Blastocatellia bacterium]|nr:protein translocase subunit SecF [Blastocatellia bacterium]
MVELFRNPQIDWIKWKKYFLPISILLLLIGAISVQLRGFNLGVDFTGGTLVTVKFKQSTSPDQIREALAAAGIETSKVTIQNVLGRTNEMMIRAPQSGNEFQDRQRIVRALQELNPSGNVPSGKANVNVINAEGIEQELRQVDPLGINDQTFAGPHPYRLVGEQVVNFRDQQHKGFIQDINALQNLTLTAGTMEGFDQAKVKSVLLDRLYAGKIDLNLVGGTEIQEALSRLDPLGIRGQANFNETYSKAADAIRRYRIDRDGVINSLDEIQVQDVSADLLAKMEPYFMTGSFAVVSAEVVGPQVGADLRNRAIYVTLAAMAGMLVYIALRFEWISAVAGIISIFHDLLITFGIFSLIQEEIDLTVVAAMLTLVGYTMNDKIVIFDRLRENLRLRRRDNLKQITNDSINQTLSRTVIT